MGELAIDTAERDSEYGLLGVRFNALRDLYKCVSVAVNTETAPDHCLQGL